MGVMCVWFVGVCGIAGFVNFFTERLPRVWWKEVGGGDVEGICVCASGFSLRKSEREKKVRIQLSR